MDIIEQIAQSSKGPIMTALVAGWANLTGSIEGVFGGLVSFAAFVLVVVSIRNKLWQTKVLKKSYEGTEERKKEGYVRERETDKL